MNATAARWFAVVVALQAALLLGWAGYHEWNRQNARTIQLETAPVDPRDILRGDHIRAVPRPPHLHERLVRPAGGLGSLHAGVDREQRRPRHAVLQSRPGRQPQRFVPVGQAPVKRARATPEGQDLLAGEGEGCHSLRPRGRRP